MRVKIIGISGSHRKGNTNVLIEECLKAARELKDVETEFIQPSDYDIAGGCTACDRCCYTPDPEQPCRGYKDDFNKIVQKLRSGDGFILGSPVYIGGLTGQLKLFTDRLVQCSVGLGGAFRNKPFGAVAVGLCNAAGQEHAVAELTRIGMWLDMLPVPIVSGWPDAGLAGPWGVVARQGYPRAVYNFMGTIELEGVRQDEAAMGCCKILGRRVAELAKVIKLGFTLANPQNGETYYPPNKFDDPKYLEEFYEARIFTEHQDAKTKSGASPNLKYFKTGIPRQK